MSEKHKKRIKDIFKSREEAHKDLVDIAKKNLEKEDKKVEKPLVEKKKKKKKKHWASRLFYGPGLLWGGGRPTCPEHPNGCPPGAHENSSPSTGSSAPAAAPSGGSSGGATGGSGGATGGGGTA